MGLLAKAKAREVKTEKPIAEPTIWKLESGDPLNEIITNLVRLDDESRAVERKAKECKEALKIFGDRQFIETCARSGELPTSPIFIQTSDGQAVSYVVQDRCSSSKLTADQFDELVDLVETQAPDLVEHRTTFSLNQTILELPGVQAVVERALEAAVKKLRDSNTITSEQADALIVAATVMSFRPKTLSRLCEICGRSKSRITSFLSIMGPAATRFIKL